MIIVIFECQFTQAYVPSQIFEYYSLFYFFYLHDCCLLVTTLISTTHVQKGGTLKHLYLPKIS